MLNAFLQQLIDGKDLTQSQSYTAMQSILQGENEVQIAALLSLMCARRETADEVLGFLKALSEDMISVPGLTQAIDIVGTGGDGYNTFNISTAAALLVASCGVDVVKNGNRAVSSQSGSSDVLSALGCRMELNAKHIMHCVEATHFAFCFSPQFNPGFAKVKNVRQALGVRTIFNLLGPLLNPAHVNYLLLGVCDEYYQPILARALAKTSIQRAMVVTGRGLDEISTVGPVKIIELRDHQLQEWILDPVDYGFSYCQHPDLKGGDAKQNAKIMLALFEGMHNAITDTVILNAAVALMICGKALSIKEGITIAKLHIKNGSALQTLQRYIEMTQKI